MTMTINTTPTETTDWAALADAVATPLEPGVAEHDRLGEIRPDVFDELRAAGITAALVPLEFGGGGATHAEMGDILRHVGRHDP
ncbi:MAG TPA: acyl-CoA dehydrogenase family protein, partial [Ilumatobacteraceae bacterium]|nr:acyl-CoA dehydrogenase family protein [Ilumatobacteraceae bacterium]